MVKRSRIIEKYIVLAARYFFGGHTFVSGINHYWPLFPDMMGNVLKTGGISGRFMTVLVESGLYDLCKIIEIVVGLALILGTFVPLALVVEVPVTAIVFYLCVFMNGSPRMIVTGWREVLFNFGLLTAYWGYFRPIFVRPMLELKPIWRDGVFTSRSEIPR